MNKGLYERAGASATERAAAWANRLEAPMTNWSKVYRGFRPPDAQSRPGSSSTTGGAVEGAGVGLDGQLDSELLAGDVPQGVGEHAGVTRADTVRGQGARDGQDEHVIVEGDGTDALEPQAPRVRSELGTQGSRAVLPDLGGADTPVKFHRCVHRCGEGSS